MPISRLSLRTIVTILLSLFIQLSSKTLCQSVSRDNFNFIFENNFEDNQVGRYLESDYFKDWNLGPSCALAPHEIIDIIADSDSKYNKVMRAYFAKGTVGPGEHGAYWEVPIPGCTEIYFSYDIRFKPGFDWVVGGKIPGVYGGKTAPGVMPGPSDGFSTRAMWKENGKPVAYVYHQNQTTLYGNSYYWGNFAFTSGKWYNVTIRVVLNTVGKANGIYEGYIDGKLMFQKKDFEYRGVESVKIEKMNISMFFGGSTPDWAPIRDEWIDTDNFVAYTYSSKATNVPKGIQAASSDWTLVHPYYNFSGTQTETLNAPSDLVEKDQTTGSINISWKDNSTNEDGFMVYRSLNETSGFEEISVCGANVTSFSDKSVNDNTTYYYRVCAFNNQGHSDLTPVLKVDVNETPTVNNPPSISDQQFTVSESTFHNDIGTVVASDKDAGQQLKYTIISDNPGNIFTIDERTGRLMASGEIFGPGTNTYKILIQVTDNAPAPEHTSAYVTITAKSNSTVVYIDPENSGDIYENGSIKHPYDSWSDIVWKGGFSYLQKKGTSSIVNTLQISASNIRIGSYGEGAKPEITSTASTYLISGFEKSQIYISGLILKAANAVSCLYFLGSDSDNDSIVIENCDISAANAVKTMDVNTLISRYNYISSDDAGIFSTAANNEIYYNVFEACNTAINIMSKSARVSIYNNVFIENILSVAVPYADMALYNNIFYLTGHLTALNYGSGKISSDHNIYYPVQSGFISIAGKAYDNLEEVQKDLGIEMKSITLNPAFVDITNKDYHLKESSPAINTGKKIDNGRDFEGNKVPLYSITDIGAFEFNGNLKKIVQNSGNQDVTLKVYPNPSSGPCTIEINVNKSVSAQEYPFITSELTIVDISGKVILSKNIDLSADYYENINLSELVNGLYFVIVHNAENSIKEKLLIQK